MNKEYDKANCTTFTAFKTMSQQQNTKKLIRLLKPDMSPWTAFRNKHKTIYLSICQNIKHAFVSYYAGQNFN